jgi:putative flippase GtrA
MTAQPLKIPIVVRPDMLSDFWRNSEKLRFLAVGGWNTLFAYLAFGTLYMLFHKQMHYLLISVMSHVLAVINAFICQRWLVFRSRSGWMRAFLRFNAVQLLVLGWCLAGLAFMVEVLHLHPLLSQSLVIAGAVFGSYIMNRNYSFRT